MEDSGEQIMAVPTEDLAEEMEDSGEATGEVVAEGMEEEVADRQWWLLKADYEILGIILIRSILLLVRRDCEEKADLRSFEG